MKNLIIILVMLLAVSCRTVKKSRTSEKEFDRKEARAVKVETERKAETLFFGDTLRGFIPRLDLSNGPVMIPISSTGISQELTFTDSGVHIQTVARPVARSQLSYSERSTDTAQVSTSYREVENTSKEVTGWGVPWWVYLVGAIMLILAVLRLFNKISNPFKWF